MVPPEKLFDVFGILVDFELLKLPVLNPPVEDFEVLELLNDLKLPDLKPPLEPELPFLPMAYTTP